VHDNKPLAWYAPMYGRILLLLACQFLEAVCTDVFTFKGFNAVGVAAKNAVGLMFLQYNGVALHKNLQLVPFVDFQHFSQFAG
jgi:hypothetical protein